MSHERKLLKDITDCIVNFEREKVKEKANEALGAGVEPFKIINSMSEGMHIVGQKYVDKEYFVSDLMMAAVTMKAGIDTLLPYLKVERSQVVGTVVIGTVKGDIHDIGKNLVSTFLTSAGFQVIDLGVDIPAGTFINEVKKNSADILAMSALLTMTKSYMKVVIDELKATGIREKVKVMVGGAPVTQKFALEIGADAYAPDAIAAVEKAKELLGRYH